MASIHRKSNNGNFAHTCGGSIINNHYVLSAAHCFQSPLDKSDFKLVFGTHDLSHKTRDTTTRLIEEIIIHPYYEEGMSYYDVALVRLDKPLIFNDGISPICIPPEAVQEANHRLHHSVSLAGWGRIKPNGPTSTVLRHTQLTIFATNYCNSTRSTVNHHGEIVSDSKLVPELFQPSILCAGLYFPNLLRTSKTYYVIHLIIS